MRAPQRPANGYITVDYEHEFAQLDDQGLRPLRTAGTDGPELGCRADRPPAPPHGEDGAGGRD
ncbi:hypothetical protein [Streptomyces anulatus]|uniref:hypothetical protein n=1 Tax=Streptomyces anulatus TaxID=1892 RepID=UPI0012FF5443|nr:hypothetical protein [Streptomyces anulatus]